MAAKEMPVIVTTKHKGVFFGYVPPKENLDVEVIRIVRARMVVSWSADVRGIVGLAAVGPSASCRIGPPAPAITLRDVTAIIEVADDAAKKMEDSPWSK